MTHLKTLLAAAAFGLALPLAAAQSKPASTEAAEATMLTAHVKGMVCDFCAQAVTKVFGKNAAVDRVHVDLDNGEIHIALKPGQTLSDDEVETMVKKSGYALVSVERAAS